MKRAIAKLNCRYYRQGWRDLYRLYGGSSPQPTAGVIPYSANALP
ncbi:hypothetical protein [Tissierella pigra]|nr:hypothetical protein [Tissierella pigra]